MRTSLVFLQFVGHLQSVGRLYGGADGNLLQEDYATCCASQVCCSQSPCPWGRPLLTLPLQETRKYSKVDLAQSLIGVSTPFPESQGAQAFVYALPTSLVSMKFESKHNFAPPLSFNNLLMVVLQLAALLVSLQKMSTRPSTPPS